MKKIITLFLCSVLFLTGCRDSSSEESLGVVQRDINEYLSVNLLFEEEDTDLYSLSAKRRSVTEDEVKNIFFDGKEMTKHEWESGGGYRYGDNVNSVVTDYAIMTFMRLNDFENYTFLARSGNSLFGPVNPQLRDYFEESELEALDYEETMKLYKGYIEKMNINCTEPEVYALEAQGLNELERLLYPDEEYQEAVKMSPEYERIRDWGVEHEAYLFNCQMTINGKMIQPFSYTPEGQLMESDFGNVMCILDRNGLVYCQVGSRLENVQKLEKTESISGTEALDKVVQLYENRAFRDDVCIDNAELVYTAFSDDRLNYTLMPVWRFRTKIKNPDVKDEDKTQYFYEYTLVNAVTGEVVL